MARVYMRRGLTALRVDDELIVELQMLVARRQDLVADRTRMVNRLREQFLALCPALERVLDVTNKGPLILLTGYQRPVDLRRLGPARLEAWLRARKVKGAQALAANAVVLWALIRDRRHYQLTPPQAQAP
ncbi:transposase [Actinomadura sp. DSM 109109]|nr:transposase [Actinomadura lepetitiana]